jgi:hypothetical protein
MEPTGAAFELKLDELTKSFGENSEFWNQFAGSGVANVFMMLAVGLFYGIRKLCERDSKCKSHIHCCCLDMDVSDRTLRQQPGSTDEAGPGAV